MVTPQMEQQARDIVSQMSLREKIDYINGDRTFYIRAIPRLGLPEIRMADGPQGVRNDTQSTMYPANICTAATWNRKLGYAMGQGIGIDCKARKVNMILGPGVNIYRSPLAGRSFEYTGEDPYLASEMAVQYVKGVQDQGIMACIKHYAANNQEWDRYTVSTDVDERTMHEIYFPAFRKAVEQADVAAVMDSYNLINSVWATENAWLNIEVLRNQWNFKGMVMSDWGAVHDAIAPIEGGMDLEMPGGDYLKYDAIAPAIESGALAEEKIDLMCQHIIQEIISYGWLNNPLQADTSIALDNPDNCQRALEIAREGITLLKNEGNALPLKGKTLVLGENADVPVMGGGSGIVHPLHNVTAWEGIKALLGKKAIRGADESVIERVEDKCFTRKDGQAGFDVNYYLNAKLEGAVQGTLVSERIDKTLIDRLTSIQPENISLVAESRFTSPITGEILFRVTGDDGYRLSLDGKEILGDWDDHSATTCESLIKVEAGKTYDVKIEYFQGEGGCELAFDPLYVTNLDEIEAKRAVQMKGVENVVICLGWNKKTELEGADHEFSLSDAQQRQLREVAKYGKKVILVLNGGGNPNVAALEPYADAIVMAYYPGQEGGTALAEILTGKVNPSGKLPYTMEKRWEDNPCYATYHDTTHEDHKRVRYTEGIFMGYRGYDQQKTEVAYPFGFGLSYTTFEYSDIQAEVVGKNKVRVSFNVKNTGKMDGKEVCQVYVHDRKASVPRPVKELKGFEKVALKKGESQRVTVTLDAEAFAFYDIHTHSFIVEPGSFDILVGGSSANLPLQTTVEL